MNSDRLFDRARQAYEWARLRRALPHALLPVPPLAIAVEVCSAELACVAGALMLSVLLVFCAWRGQVFERAIAPGLMAGLAAFLLPLAGRLLGGCGVAIFAESGGLSASFAACVLGGALAGAFVASRVMRAEGERLVLLLTATTIASLLGSLGCAIAGLAGVSGMLAGVALSAGPLWVWGRARA